MTTIKTAPAAARKTPAEETEQKTLEKKPVKKPEKQPEKPRKDKAVRDSFTMPQSEYRKIAEIKETCLKAGLPVKKSEVLRAGLKTLCGMNAAQLKRTMAAVEKIKTGRPRKS